MPKPSSREAISNAVRHAEASNLTVTIDVADQLCVDVIDNGKGIPDNITGSGLVNLSQRAQAVSYHPAWPRRRHAAELVGTPALARSCGGF